MRVSDKKQYLSRNTLDFVVIMALIMFGLFEFMSNTAETHFGHWGVLVVFLIVIVYILSATIGNFYPVIKDIARKLKEEPDYEKKKKTIEELETLRGYIKEVLEWEIDNKSKHGAITLLEKYKWLVGEIDVDKGVSVRVMDSRIDRIIATMKIYPYKKALEELGVEN